MGGQRDGAKNQEPPKKPLPAARKFLRAMRRDDLHAGMVGVHDGKPRSASVGMRGVRLQVRDAGLLSCTMRRVDDHRLPASSIPIIREPSAVPRALLCLLAVATRRATHATTDDPRFSGSL